MFFSFQSSTFFNYTDCKNVVSHNGWFPYNRDRRRPNRRTADDRTSAGAMTGTCRTCPAPNETETKTGTDSVIHYTTLKTTKIYQFNLLFLTRQSTGKKNRI